MTDALNPIKFDLAQTLAGQTYPTETVVIPLNREAAARVSELRDLMDQAKRRPDPEAALEVLQPEYDAAFEAAGENVLLVTVRGLSRDAARSLSLLIQRTISEESDEGIEDEFEKYKHSLKVGERIQAYTWAAYITKVGVPGGEEIEVTTEEAELLIRELTNPSAELIENAIKRLENRATVGFEEVVKNVDFSSAP